jgi:phosphoribosylformylglycinamidine cyclo-ligase
VFLDYVAMAKDDPPLTRDIIKGISDGCYEAECALVGGETAILPDFYQPGDYDLAGFCVGVVEKDHIVNGRAIRPGDAVIGVSSSGVHSNGYSLVRKVVFDHAGHKIKDFVKELGRTVGEELLEPTRIYVRPIKSLLKHYPVKKRVIRGLAHITGGGLVDNVPRILPPGRRVFIRRGSWPMPPVFPWMQRLGNIDQDEMDRVFNCGIGFVIIASPYFAESIQRQLAEDRFPSHIIGEVREGEPGLEYIG